MNLHWFDWVIVAVLFGFVTVMAVATKRYTRSVADFLAAGCSAGRYVITVSEGAAALGAITVVATFEKIFQAGFTAQWWDVPVLSIGYFTALAGWVIYRFRQTRAMTMAQFFEMRYSRRFRIFAGLMAFIAGIVNFGIFPAVGARFFIYFCGLPESFQLGGVAISTFPSIMVGLLTVAVLFIVLGGQIAVIVTDFIQGLFTLGVFCILFAYLASKFEWIQIEEVFRRRPENASLLNPFMTRDIEGFDLYFFLIGIFGAIYMTMSWQGTQGYNCSAHSAHEAKMGKVLGMWRYTVQGMLILIMPICAYTFLHHPDFADSAAGVQDTLAGIDNEQIRKQMTVPVTLSAMLPHGAMGALCAVMLAAFISTHDSYLHSWGSIFIQDVIMPFRRKPFAPKRHLLLLRLSTCGVAVFIFFFSLLFRQTEYIFMFFAITGAIFMGGSGSVIIGGLYWRRGTTAGAWSSMIVGSVLAVSGIVIRQPAVADWVLALSMPDGLHRALAFIVKLDGQRMFFFAMISAIGTYVVVSLLSRQPKADFDRLFHAPVTPAASGATEDHTGVDHTGAAGSRSRSHRSEYSRGDRWIYGGFITYLALWGILFVMTLLYQRIYGVPERFWISFWHYYLWGALFLGVGTTVWFTIGGIGDLRDMFRRLAAATRDDADDGFIAAPEKDA